MDTQEFRESREKEGNPEKSDIRDIRVTKDPRVYQVCQARKVFRETRDSRVIRDPLVYPELLVYLVRTVITGARENRESRDVTVCLENLE